MGYIKIFGNPVGEGSEFEQVQKIKIGGTGLFISFQTVFSHTTDRTTGAVFKNYLGPGFG